MTEEIQEYTEQEVVQNNNTTVNLDAISEPTTANVYEEQDDEKFFDDFFSDE